MTALNCSQSDLVGIEISGMDIAIKADFQKEIKLEWLIFTQVQ